MASRRAIRTSVLAMIVPLRYERSGKARARVVNGP
jgi:hypothetical protein